MSTNRAVAVVSQLEKVKSLVAAAVAKRSMPQECTLVAVSKTKPVEDIKAAYDAGQRHFGENYIQEIVEKAPQLPDDIKWHFIGHIQSNKAKKLVQNVQSLHVVETLDSIKLANMLNKLVEKPLRVMVQVNTSGESQKSGVEVEESPVLVKHILDNCEALRFCGLMTIGRLGEIDPICFERMVECQRLVATELSIPIESIELSMGGWPWLTSSLRLHWEVLMSELALRYSVLDQLKARGFFTPNFNVRAPLRSIQRK